MSPKSFHRLTTGWFSLALLTLASCSFAGTSKHPATGAPMNNTPAVENTHYEIPSNTVRWVKSALITRIKNMGATTMKYPVDLIPLGIGVEFQNPSSEPAQLTGRPMPKVPFVKVYSNGQEIRLAAPKHKGPVPNVSRIPAKPITDEEILRDTTQLAAHSKKDGYVEVFLGEYQLLVGTHVYELVAWKSGLNQLDITRLYKESTAQGNKTFADPLTDNAPSNRLYFKVYVPTAEEAAKGKTAKFLGEVDAATQVPALPYARPGDFAPKSGQWRAEGRAIDEIGSGVHEVKVKKGQSMPNLPGSVGADPFGFRWKLLRED
jgi:hypothetical protein